MSINVSDQMLEIVSNQYNYKARTVVRIYLSNITKLSYINFNTIYIYQILIVYSIKNLVIYLIKVILRRERIVVVPVEGLTESINTIEGEFSQTIHILIFNKDELRN